MHNNLVNYIISRTVTSNDALKSINGFIEYPMHYRNLPTNETVIRLKHLY